MSLPRHRVIRELASRDMSPKAASRRAAGAKSKPRSRTMSSSHKAALAEGRNESRSVRVYLEALESQRPKRGRKRTPESVKRRLASVNAALPNADPLRRVQLVQEQMDLRNELDAMNNKVDLRKLEAEFIASAKNYSQRKGISYSAWRSVGVPPAVLKKAGISRSD